MLHIIHALALLFSLSIVVDGVTFSMIFKVPRIEDKCPEKVWYNLLMLIKQESNAERRWRMYFIINKTRYGMAIFSAKMFLLRFNVNDFGVYIYIRQTK